ncbi:MAG: malto-oligosyltrehalose trehalohydrolase [Xanthobacteraceae bacterium]|nr:malto-oligosyltrehalose trehalohydrolase [Xanthobacteraceae bacterium]
MKQRWYPAKDLGVPEVVCSRSLPSLSEMGIPGALGIWEARPPGRPPMRLFLPLAVVAKAAADTDHVIAEVPSQTGEPTDQVLVDAFSTDEFVRSWVSAPIGDIPTGDAILRSSRTSYFSPNRLDEGLRAITHSKAEQSNTSIRIGDVAVLKIIRKLEEGIHPELEISRYLTDVGFAATPHLLGWRELQIRDEDAPVCLSLLQGFVAHKSTAWDWMVEQLGQLVAHAETGKDVAIKRDVSNWLSTLGRRTAQMHHAFAEKCSNPAFTPEQVGLSDLSSWTSSAQGIARRALKGLEENPASNDEAVRPLASELLRKREQIEERLARLVDLPAAFAKTRHHGDYHLGQVLVTGTDAVILDFEGEPLRSLVERRAKHMVLRDVAGMLRSIAYAAETAARALPSGNGPEQKTAQASLQAWRKDAAHDFAEAYFSAAEGLVSLPRVRAQSEELLKFFLLEKALYEVAYELAHRPDWISTPLRGVLDLLADQPEPSAALRRVHTMPFGAEMQPGGVRFRLWAPSHANVLLEFDGSTHRRVMSRLEGGWHELICETAKAGTRYRFILPDGLRVPDPASRYQPDDVHGRSEVIDPAAYKWDDAEWRGRPWKEAVIYELHVGAFTSNGTFNAAVEKLDHLVDLGVTAIQLMPIADFPGKRNWGYDGVLPYAPDSTYGQPEDLKNFIDAAHQRGLMVLLDVVYNHFGPEGAYLHSIAPQTFTNRHKTPWGAAINTDGPDARTVRDFFIENAIYWLNEYHLDGLRLDAVHALLDESSEHILKELAERVRAATRGRHVHLILENEENEAHRLVRHPNGEPRWYTAQWNDDAHHALHVAVTGEAQGYYGDYHNDTEKLGRALAEGFAFQGELMPYRGRPRGETSSNLPPSAFVTFLQNHDQVGNRAFGERLTAIANDEAVRAACAAYLLLPQIPMLFMGEEWAAAQPFPFFCDFGPELADAVRKGRREEFAKFPEFHDPATRERIPDPTAADTFKSAKLKWEAIARAPHGQWLDWYRRILAVRRREIRPRISQIRHGGRFECVAKQAVCVRWQLEQSDELLLLEANLSDRPVGGFARGAKVKSFWLEGSIPEEGVLAPFSVRWSI